MIAGMAGVPRVAYGALAIDDERARELHHVADRALDMVTLARRLEAVRNHGGVEQDVLPGAALQAEHLVALPLRIGEAGKLDAEAVAERLRLLRVALRHDHDSTAGLLDVVRALTERFQVLPAERSAEVAQER